MVKERILNRTGYTVSMYGSGNEQNSYGGYYGTPENPMGTNVAFARASMICGFISLGLAVSAFFSAFAVPVAAVGIILAMLSSRRGKNLPRKAMTGVIASAAGLFIGLVILVASMVTVLTSDSLGNMMKTYEDMYEQTFGEDFDWSTYGIDTGKYI